MNTMMLAAAGGVGILTALQVWAYRASPSWASKRGARDEPGARSMTVATFRRRLLVYYGAALLFVALWLAHALVLEHRAAELQRAIDGKSGR